jgi:MarR family 2-MHQ and catechol resistance regulon transcriptional repressor
VAAEPRDAADPVTLVGLVLETATGMRRLLGPRLEKDCGLPGPAFEILLRLLRSPGRRLRMSELAAQTSLSPSGLTRAVDRLDREGLVVRLECPNDRRGTFAALTEAGVLRAREALELHVAELEELLGDLFDADEARSLARALHKLRDRVRPELASPPRHAAEQVTDARRPSP